MIFKTFCFRTKQLETLQSHLWLYEVFSHFWVTHRL